MTLPITESILRGELRPNILKQSLERKSLEQLIRNSRKVSQKSKLMELEFAINEVLNGLVNTKDIYKEDQKTLDAAIHVRKNKIIRNEPRFKYLDSEVIIDNVLSLPDLNSPLLRFYNTLLDAEVLRTRLALIHLSWAAKDDAFMRSTLKAIFKIIKNFCIESQQWEENQNVMLIIPVKLTHLYFTLLNTYKKVLVSYDTPEYEDDFKDFVYDWKGEYPLNEEVTKYIEQSGKRAEIVNKIVDDSVGEKPQDPSGGEQPNRPKDKADIFLDGVANYNFLEMPKIKLLGSLEKIHSLVMTMLECPGRACAMLEYLQFYEWIKSTQKVKFTRQKYDILCSKLVMGFDNSEAFHTVRMSLNKNNKNASKYKAYEYIGKVDDDYDQLLKE